MKIPSLDKVCTFGIDVANLLPISEEDREYTIARNLIPLKFNGMLFLSAEQQKEECMNLMYHSAEQLKLFQISKEQIEVLLAKHPKAVQTFFKKYYGEI